jgi:hypothetical protein
MASVPPLGYVEDAMRTALVSILIVTGLCACVERRMTIRTEPAGAAVDLDGRRLPRATPVTVSPTHAGHHLVVVSADGHRSAAAVVRVEEPWYDRFPLDLFAEVLWPGVLRSETTVDLRLEPRSEEGPPESELDLLKERADAVRRSVLGEDDAPDRPADDG